PLAPTTSLFFTPSLAPPDRHSFPTRRSSDLPCRPTPDGRGHLSRKPVRPAMPASIGVKSVGTAVAGRPRGTSDARRTSAPPAEPDRKSTRLNSSHVKISYAVFCLKKKKTERE